ncbi:FIST N-terminal domain-containing protein [Alkalinema sp. FACHB-956]|uniref:FIST signal transduction protein n=1 Tax=Alkalinema sp. FACHB-956 TaxID=2692768 RepID=UPI001685C33C|nr:FIST N-terminal domain-containing protein [Alkalinema sp. FACHB-956]MBD2328795.1 FIST C-terminal domain-containing protein [Alkalinema sp. FACHB-956]
MKWSSALSTRPSLEAAIAEVVEQAQAQLGVPADVGFLFVSSAFTSEYARILPLLQPQLPNVPVIGCNGSGIIGINSRGTVREVEDEVAISLILGSLPGVEVHPFYISMETLPDLDSAPSAWAELVGLPEAAQPQFVLLADPFSTGINDFLAGLDYAFPQSPKVGGIASSGITNGSSGLFCVDRFHRSGLVGIALTGNIVIDTIVAQGCRPIGQPYCVVESERNIILKMESEAENSTIQGSPLEMLRDLIQTLSEEDKVLAQSALFVGVAQTEFKQCLESGDFLIRNLLGFDPREGALAIGDRIRPGQRIQFHLRDAATSEEDLETLLRKYQLNAMNHSKAQGALMFACLGRGESLYGEPNFDSQLFSRYVDHVPIGGFFCNGEIGPVGTTSYLHGFTSVFGIFREK